MTLDPDIISKAAIGTSILHHFAVGNERIAPKILTRRNAACGNSKAAVGVGHAAEVNSLRRLNPRAWRDFCKHG